MVSCENVTKKYMSKIAVDSASLQIEPGKIYALLGPNGSGKTTLMKIISGLIQPTSGNVLYRDQPVGVESKKHIAYMSTEPFFYNYMTVADVGKYYKDFFEDFSQEKYEMLLERMELDLKDKAKSLSSGMAAKLKIACTLARNSELFLLDEPLNGIDIIAREKIITTIMEAAKANNTVMMSSHLVDELEKIIDYAVFMKKSLIVLSGKAEDIRQEKGKSIVEVYKEIYA